jgi:hypothetical protein
VNLIGSFDWQKNKMPDQKGKKKERERPPRIVVLHEAGVGAVRTVLFDSGAEAAGNTRGLWVKSFIYKFFNFFFFFFFFLPLEIGPIFDEFFFEMLVQMNRCSGYSRIFFSLCAVRLCCSCIYLMCFLFCFFFCHVPIRCACHARNPLQP